MFLRNQLKDASINKESIKKCCCALLFKSINHEKHLNIYI